MSSITPLQIPLSPSDPTEGYEEIGTLNHLERFVGHTIKGYNTAYLKDRKCFRIGLEGYESVEFNLAGRFKVFKNLNNTAPAQLIVVENKTMDKILALRGHQKSKSLTDGKPVRHKTVYISSDELKRRKSTDRREKLDT